MIISAACRAVVNGEEHIFPVHRHGDFYLWMKYLKCDYKKGEVETGFIDWDWTTKTERFVSREEAAQIVIDCGQKVVSKDFNPHCLYSEDIY